MKALGQPAATIEILFIILFASGICEAQRQDSTPKPQISVLSAPSATSTNAAANQGRPETPIPERLRPEVVRAEILGHAIYTNDMLAAWGSDALLAAKLPNANQCRGWITRRGKDGWKVHFMGEDHGKSVELWTVDFAEFAPKAARLQTRAKPRPLDDELAAMYRAQQTAMASQQFVRHTERYNPVVLSGALINQPGWLVYLLAAIMDENAIAVGGHYCMRVSADGKKLIETRPLSRSFLVLEKPSNFAGACMSHIISETPIETHVFVSLLHRPFLFSVIIPVGPGTASTWSVKEGKITSTGIMVHDQESDKATKP